MTVSEPWIRRVLCGAALVSAAAACGILLVLIYLVVPLFAAGQPGTVLSWQWLPFQGKFGILPMAAGSLLLSVGALLIATPLAVGVSCFVQVLAPEPIKGVGLAVVHYMTSVPTVIYGFVSVFLLVPLMRQWFDRGTGFSLATAMIALTLLILPTIILVFQATLREVDRSARLSCDALGFSKPAYIRHILLPLARRGLLAAVILGFGRAIGDTLISLMLAGNAPIVPTSPLDSIRTLTAHIALVVATDSQSTFYHSVFASGLILFFTMILINLALRRLGSSFAP